MRAGGSPPATHERFEPGSATIDTTFNEGRGFTPGDTGAVTSLPAPHESPFNEGRGFTPGDTVSTGPISTDATNVQ